MTKQEAMEKLEKYHRSGLWLYRNSEGRFCIKAFYKDPWWIKEAIYLFSQDQLEAAAEWVAEVTEEVA